MPFLVTAIGAIGAVLMLSLIHTLTIWGKTCYYVGEETFDTVCITPGVYFTLWAGVIVMLSGGLFWMAKAYILNRPTASAGVVPYSSQASEQGSSPSPFATAATPSPVKPAVRYDRQKWGVLKEVDNDINGAAETALKLGPKYEDLLAEKYLTLGDKAYLPAILAKLKEQYDTEQEADAKLKKEASEIKSFTAAAIYEKFMAKVSANDGVDPDNGLRVVSAVEYKGPATGFHGGIKIIYDNGRTVLRSQSIARRFETETQADAWGADTTNS